MELRIGASATGPNFWPRPRLLARLTRALKGDNVSFPGPRRTGKTSCIEALRAEPGPYVPILLNLEQHTSVEAWLEEMLTALRVALNQPRTLQQVASQRVKALLDRIQKLEIPAVGAVELRSSGAPPAWLATANELLALLQESQIPILFLLDEFPTFLRLVAKHRSPKEVEAVLTWFRAARQSLRDHEIRFLVTGSIGLKGVVRRLQLSPTIIEFDTHEITPLDSADASAFALRLAKDNRIPLDEAGVQHLLQRIGIHWPILIQLYLSEIQEAGLSHPPTILELDRLYDERLVRGSRNQYCDNMWERLADVFTESERRLAREMLKATAKAPDGLTRDEYESLHARLEPELSRRSSGQEELDQVLETLQADGYLLKDASEVPRSRFGSRILGDYWRRRTL